MHAHEEETYIHKNDLVIQSQIDWIENNYTSIILPKYAMLANRLHRRLEFEIKI